MDYITVQTPGMFLRGEIPRYSSSDKKKPHFPDTIEGLTMRSLNLGHHFKFGIYILERLCVSLTHQVSKACSADKEETFPPTG